ncbi:cupin domain-containing protein [Kitasatospora sp. NBC_01287]|uniref:cupin domain-containing protein n=1 Tax=Kitasatospora sp. NBC_01287 TaxID=2903573 RepID=UPI002250077A|nr:cupin domain-containing protein [Kitasatospora sp. NBC_01287]MCX4747570.1 cupin domain-containing protein [Kitasatospora sp. NBC_01287]
MRLLPIDRAEHLITRFASTGAHATRLAAGTGQYYLTCLSIEPGGTIGTHPAPVEQLFLVITGEGWITGPDDIRVPIAAGTAVLWSAEEEHTCGTDTGLTALALEGAGLTVFEAEDY